MKRASVFAFLPQLRHDWGPRSPWGRYMAMRREFDAIIDSLIVKHKNDPNLDQRDDVLSLLQQATYEDGTPMSNSEICDELFTLLAAGHETTATSLAWTVERLRRHPVVLSRLVDEVDADGSDLLQATINEVQRNRPVIDACARQVIAPSINLGQWVIPSGYMIRVDIPLTHHNEAVFPDAQRFDPDRFLNSKPDMYSWIPFGGGTRRCIGAAFANMEMTGVVRTMLREVRLVPTDAPSERTRNRGVAYAPHRGGRAVIHRRVRNVSP
jgi:cytochrome P450